jgi:hypothetical protein
MRIEMQQTHTAWKAFSSGMYMLQKYATRSCVDINSTAAANLRLLHKTLYKDKTYKAAILRAAAGALPMTHWLVESSDVQARFISLGNTTPVTISARGNELVMFLLISGKIECQHDDIVAQGRPLRMTTLEDRKRRESEGWRKTYKVGDTFLNQFMGPSTHRITTLEKHSVLLDIRLAPYGGGRDDSYPASRNLDRLAS